MKNELIIDLDDGSSYINRYNKNKLSRDLYDYIVDEVKGFSLNKKIEIKVYSNYLMTDIEKDNFVEMIRSNFGSDIQEEVIMQTYVYYKSLALLLIGLLGVGVYYLLAHYNVEFFAEIFLIIGWLGIWEAVYALLYEKIAGRIKAKRFRQIVNARIDFEGN